MKKWHPDKCVRNRYQPLISQQDDKTCEKQQTQVVLCLLAY